MLAGRNQQEERAVSEYEMMHLAVVLGKKKLN